MLTEWYFIRSLTHPNELEFRDDAFEESVQELMADEPDDFQDVPPRPPEP